MSQPIHKHVFSLLITIILSIVVGPLSLRAEKADSHETLLDLSEYNERQGTLELKGPWEFYWNQWIEPGNNDKAPDAIFQKPQGWSGLTLADGRTLPSHGYASYRLRIRGLTPDVRGYQIGLYAADSAFRVIVYSEGLASEAVLSESGQPGVSASAEHPSRKAAFRAFFPKKGRDTIVIIQVSNFQQAYGGLWQAPVLGVHDSARTSFDKDGLFNILGLGVVIAIGIYSFMMFLRRREDEPAMFLAATAVSALLRITSTNSFITSLFPDDAYSLLRKTEYASMSLGLMAYLAFQKTAFFRERFKILILSIVSLHATLAFLAFVTPVSILTQGLAVYQLSILLTVPVFIFLITLAIKQKQSGSLLVLTGCLLIVTGFLFDIIITTELKLSNLLITPLCVASFLILQSQLVAQRAAEAYRRAEVYAEELVEKEKARTLFFHNTSHELRTPLNGIIGFLQLVLKGRYGSIPEAADTQIQKSLRLAEALKNQVNTILDLAKSRRGDLQKRKQLVPLQDLKAEADYLAEGLGLKNLRSSYTSTLEVDQQDEPFISDKEKVLTILRNLLGNAFKFAAPDRPNQVSLSLSCKQKRLIIEVKDTGIGIDPRFHSKIFEEFAQVQGDARRAYEGTGLGLTMARDLVKLLGGTIHLESSLGQGSCFRVSLPSQDQVDLQQYEPEEQHTKADLELLRNRPRSETKLSPALPATAATHRPKISQSWQILIIDDTETNCEVISEILKDEGYSASYQLSGRAGLLHMRKNKPSLVLLDMMMPEMSGEDVLREMKADSLLHDIPVVLITARASDEDRLLGLKMGVDDYLAKPIVAEELLLRVHNLLERHHLLREVERHQTLDKMVQLGTLFADLSHEIKNILQGSATVPKLQKNQIHLALSPVEIQEDYVQALIQSIYSNNKNPETLKRMNAIHTTDNDEYNSIRLSLKGLLAESSLSYNMMLNLWTDSQAMSVDELVFLENQIRVLTGFQTLAQITERTRSLSLSVLNYTRTSEESAACQLNSVWPDVLQLSHGRARKIAVTWQVDLEDAALAISPHALTQILLNLTLNALDAIATWPSVDRWIKVSMKREGEQLVILMENGGPAIAEEVRVKLFTRGFTTKGERGSGIGLYVSQRLARQAGGDLIYQIGAQHPTFVLTVPFLTEAALARSA